MPSTAISAQGSTLSVGNGSGGAKTITSVAVGFPTILTSSAHGFANGDIVTFSSNFAGANASALNGLTVVVKNKTTNTFAVDVDTTGLTITAGTATATPTAWTAVGNFKTFNGFDGQPSELDVSNLSSSAKEFRTGLVDNGSLQVELDLDSADAGQALLLAAYLASTSKQFKVTLPDTHTASFTGYVRKCTAQGGVDQVVKRQVDIRISGVVTWA